MESVSRTVVEFVLERNIDLAVQDVREKISTIRNKLPEDIEEPRIARSIRFDTDFIYESFRR